MYCLVGFDCDSSMVVEIEDLGEQLDNAKANIAKGWVYMQ